MSLPTQTPLNTADGQKEAKTQGGVTTDLLSTVTSSGTRRIDSWFSTSTKLGRPSRTWSSPGPDLSPARTAGGPSPGAPGPGSPHAVDQVDVLLDDQASLVPSVSPPASLGPPPLPPAISSYADDADLAHFVSVADRRRAPGFSTIDF
jgi:hypothetical protein